MNRPNRISGQPLRNYIYLEVTSTIDYRYAVLDNILRDFIDIVDDISI